MERELDVVIARGDETIAVGTLWARVRSARESASFEYAASWLRDRHAFALDPELPLATGLFHTARPLFNAFTDPMPDRWGQTLLRRNERARARAEERAPRTLFTSDFLALVDDETRLGALRFREPGAPQFLTIGGRVPPLVQLPRLLRASTRVLADEESDDDLLLLLAPGTSLGGARPKASVRRADDSLAIAKFPARDDDWPVTRWEATTLALAAAADIDVPAHELVVVTGRPVLVAQRFDRVGPRRIPYMSALTALAARDGDTRSYIEIAEALRTMGAAVARDLPQLWTRMVFNILVSNTDDHLRNHGFLYEPRGWRLSPAFDLNPMPIDVRPRVHALALDEVDQTASLETALSVAPSFALPNTRAKAIARQVGRAVRRWRKVAEQHGLSRRQIERMASAFEHDDLRMASR
jgi:serine/threonine-protein kinase HipA